jgi:CheY-like chemotaxis protein
MSPSPPALHPRDLATLKVLVVDDNTNTQRMISDVLRAAGVGQIDTATDGERARDMLAGCGPHIIFSDWHMPVMGGLELTRTIRRGVLCPDRRIPNPQVPIVLVTSRRNEADVQAARQAGVNEFVIKPFTPAALLSRLQLVLLKPRPFIVSEEYIGPDRRRRLDPSYAGALRRASDPVELVDEVALAALRDILALELQGLHDLIGSRGVDGEMLTKVYRVMQRISFRSHQVRDTAVQRVAVLQMEYIDAMAAPEYCELDVFDAHFRVMGTLLASSAVGADEALNMVARLEAAVRQKIARRRAA